MQVETLMSVVRAIIQRTRRASVTIDDKMISEIDTGLLVLLGVEDGDGAEDINWLSSKISRMRIFADDEGKMNRSVVDCNGGLLIVSQFTLHASTRKGNRPSFLRAAHPSISEPLYQKFCSAMETEIGRPVGRGIFGADMQVELVNDGPVTISIDSRSKE